jgi:hypothetical protein
VVDFARPATGEPNRLMITLIAMAAPVTGSLAGRMGRA